MAFFQSCKDYLPLLQPYPVVSSGSLVIHPRKCPPPWIPPLLAPTMRHPPPVASERTGLNQRRQTNETTSIFVYNPGGRGPCPPISRLLVILPESDPGLWVLPQTTTNIRIPLDRRAFYIHRPLSFPLLKCSHLFPCLFSNPFCPLLSGRQVALFPSINLLSLLFLIFLP